MLEEGGQSRSIGAGNRRALAQRFGCARPREASEKLTRVVRGEEVRVAVAVRKAISTMAYRGHDLRDHRRARVCLLSSVVLALSATGVVGCDSCDLPQFEPGTRFLVTVQNEESVCGGRINFSAGETFELVAGRTRRSAGDDCEYTPAEGVPAFSDSRYEFVQCQGGLSPLALSCSITLPECSDADISLYVEDVPEGLSKVSTTYYFNVQGRGRNAARTLRAASNPSPSPSSASEPALKNQP